MNDVQRLDKWDKPACVLFFSVIGIPLLMLIGVVWQHYSQEYVEKQLAPIMEEFRYVAITQGPLEEVLKKRDGFFRTHPQFEANDVYWKVVTIWQNPREISCEFYGRYTYKPWKAWF